MSARPCCACATAGPGRPCCCCTDTRERTRRGTASRRCWRAGYTVVCPDLRGYGESSKPPTTPDHEPYSKRAMARDWWP